ncbi:MAG: hypothetical protein AAFO81_02415 [Pseudomonadota bacterium]
MSNRPNPYIALAITAIIAAVSGCASDPSLQSNALCGGDDYLGTHASAFQENRFAEQARADNVLPGMSENQNLYIAERQRSNSAHATQHVASCRQHVRRARAEHRRELSEGLQSAVAQR